MDLIEVTWVWDEALQEWVLIAREPSPREKKDAWNTTEDHWMKDAEEN